MLNNEAKEKLFERYIGDGSKPLPITLPIDTTTTKLKLKWPLRDKVKIKIPIKKKEKEIPLESELERVFRQVFRESVSITSSTVRLGNTSGNVYVNKRYLGHKVTVIIW